MSGWRNLAINPFNGESLSEHMLDVWLKGISARRRNCFMKTLMKLITLSNPQIAGYTQSFVDGRKSDGLALRTSEALLQFNPEDPYEIAIAG